MNKILKLVKSKNDKELMESIENLKSKEGIVLLLDEILIDRNTRKCFIALNSIVKNKKLNEYFVEKLKKVNFVPITKNLENEDSKVRKNVYSLLGYLDDEFSNPILIKALDKEETLFNIPVIFKSLSNNADVSDILSEKLNQLIEKYGSEDKHIKKLSEEKRKADNKHINRDCLKLQKIPPFPMLLKVMSTQKKYLFNDLKKSYKSAILKNNYIVIKKPEFKLFDVRYIKDFLFDLGIYSNDINFNFAEKIYKKLPISLLNDIHKSNRKTFYYRIENKIKGKDRIEVIKKLNESLTSYYGDKLVNNPNSYDFEIRLTYINDKFCVLIKFFTLKDSRFDYRKKSLPASINGYNAYTCLKLCNKYFKQNAIVLDPFIGTGTMLKERLNFGKCKLYGVDKSEKAINFAKENLGNLIKLNHSDIKRFETKLKFDEIISNMPYGIRVGSHDNNTVLYDNFLKKIKKILAPDGKVFLLTTDYKTLNNLAVKYGFKKLEEHIIECGGLKPHLCIYNN